MKWNGRRDWKQLEKKIKDEFEVGIHSRVRISLPLESFDGLERQWSYSQYLMGYVIFITLLLLLFMLRNFGKEKLINVLQNYFIGYIILDF